MRAWPLLTVSLGLVACPTDPLPSPSAVTSLRVVALTTDTPEVRPGASARVEAVVLDPRAPRAVVVRWRLCDEATVSDPRVCPTAPDGVELGTGPSVVLPALTGDAEGRASYLVLAAACVGTLATLDPTTGHYRCEGEGVEVFRRVLVRRDEALNRPPVVASWELTRGATTVPLSLSGGAVALPPCAGGDCAWTWRVRPTETSAELTPQGERESLAASFYVTAGSTDHPRDVANAGDLRALSVKWAPPPEGSAAELRMVLRDQRGGESALGARVTGSAR